MNNTEIADIFERIANLLEIKGEIVYKTLAYRHAAENIRLLTVDLSRMTEKEILEIPGVGQAIAEKIHKLLTTGKLAFLQKLENEVPPSLIDLLKVPDLGPKKAALFWKQAGIIDLVGLEAAARAGRLRDLPGLGEKSEQRILAGLEALKQPKPRIPIHKALAIVESWLSKLRQIPGLKKVEAAGSLRRWKTSIGDLDIVGASQQPEEVMQAFIKLPGIQRVLTHGENKSSVSIEEGLNMQLWLQPPERFGSLLQFVTGSKEHNVRLREYALKQGLSLSERGFVSQDLKEILCRDDSDVYQTLGLPFIPPELREDRGEIQAAIEGKLPQLVQLEDIQADLHTHSSWSDGKSNIEEMIKAVQQVGLKMLAITDHSPSCTEVRGLDENLLYQQEQEIKRLQDKFGDSVHLLCGIEVEILEDGRLDLPDELLAKLDIVIASMHEQVDKPRDVVTQRLIKAMCNPYVDIIAHPSGREMPRTEGADLNWELIFKAALENNVALEINSNPIHLDMDEAHARIAAEKGIPIVINTDAHAVERFKDRRYGVAVARRAWVEKESVINAWPMDKILDWLKNHQ